MLIAVGCFLTHRFGGDEPARRELLPALLDELDAVDDEHPDVSVSDAEGWCLSAYASGLVVWGNVESDRDVGQRHQVSRTEMLRLFEHLLDGRRDLIDAEPWA